MRARIRDTEIYFDIDGSGLVASGEGMLERPTVFLIHGGPGADHTGFKPALTPLTEVAQVVYFDHRGQGRSARGPIETYTLENNVADMEALRDYLGINKIIPVGFSYGGVVAQAYAAQYPQNVAALVAAVTIADSSFIAEAQENLQRLGNEEQIAIARHLWDGTFADDEHLQAYFRIMEPLYSLSSRGSSLRVGTQKRRIVSADAINVAFGGFMRHFDLKSELPRISAPTLVIGADQDWICPPHHAERIAALIPGSKLEIFESCGHSVRDDQPERLVASLRRFMESIFSKHCD